MFDFKSGRWLDVWTFIVNALWVVVPIAIGCEYIVTSHPTSGEYGVIYWFVLATLVIVSLAGFCKATAKWSPYRRFFLGGGWVAFLFVLFLLIGFLDGFSRSGLHGMP